MRSAARGILSCSLGLALLVPASGCREEPQPGAQPVPAPLRAGHTAPSGETAARRQILILGDSLTAGYGLDPSQAYPARIQEKIDRLGWDFEVVDAGVSGETSSGGLRRIDWLLGDRPVDVFILELGANDGLRGVDLAVTRANLAAIVHKVRTHSPAVDVVIAGMMVPPSLGRVYAEPFARIFPELAESEGATLIPFILEGVAGRPQLNQADGIHPTPEGHRIMAGVVWEVLEPILSRRVPAAAR